MEATRLDSMVKILTTGASRRQVIAGMGATVLGLTALTVGSQTAMADARHRCHQRCDDHHDNNEARRHCKDRCERNH